MGGAMSLKDHPAVLVGLISAGLVAARLLAIARFDVSTAATILSVAGTGTAVAGTMLTLLPFALVLLSCYVAVTVFIDHRLLPVSPGGARLLLALSVGGTLCLAALPLAAATIVAVALAAALGRAAGHDDDAPRVAEVVRSSRLLQVLGTALLVVASLTPILLQRPWLPIQAVDLDGDRLLVGYILGDADGDLALMNERDRSITFVETDDIESRSICSGGSTPGGAAQGLPRLQLSGSLIGTLLWGDDVPRYPACPRPRG